MLLINQSAACDSAVWLIFKKKNISSIPQLLMQPNSDTLIDYRSTLIAPDERGPTLIAPDDRVRPTRPIRPAL